MSKAVLLIDDDADDRDLFVEALEATGRDFYCVTAADPEMGLSALQGFGEDLPHLLFIDINLPLKSGWEVLEEIKSIEKYKDLKIVMYSTSNHPSDYEKAIKLGALKFLSKPSDYRSLIITLDSLL